MRRARSGRARGVLVLGGAALVAVGLWLGGLLKGFGLGGGDGVPGLPTSSTNTGTQTGSDDGRDEGRGDGQDNGKTDGPTIQPLTRDPEVTVAGDRTGPLHVVMEPNGYSLAVLQKDGKTGYVPITLEQIVAEAPAAEESPDGYRVLITSRRRVSAGAHLDLVRQLEAAGLKPDEILGYESRDIANEDGE